jgi:DNA invertase Pin-like site-specific DNA recombinase
VHELGRQRRRDKEPDKRQRATIEAYARHAGFELIAHYVERGRKGVKRSRVALQDIERRLAMRDLEAAVDQDVLATMQQKAQRELKQYEDALNIATTVLGERRQ